MPPPIKPPPAKTIAEEDDLENLTIEELEKLLLERGLPSEELYTQPPVGGIVTQKSTPIGVARADEFEEPSEFYSIPEAESAESKWNKFKKAAAVTKRARSPEFLAKKEEKLRGQFLNLYNRSAQKQLLTSGPASKAFQDAGGKIFPKDTPLDELLKATSKTSQGSGLQNIRDELNKVRLEKKIGAINIELGDSLLTVGQRTFLAAANAGDKAGVLKGFDGVDLVHHDKELDTYIIKMKDGRWGLADEKGAGIGDVFDVAPVALDVALSIFALGTAPESAGMSLTAKEGMKKGLWGLFRKAVASTPTRRAITTGTVMSSSQLAREWASQKGLVEGATPVPAGTLVKEAVTTGLLTGAGQRGLEWMGAGAKGAAEKIIKAGEKPALVETAIAARKKLEMPPLTAAEVNVALAKAEATIAEMPLAIGLKKRFQDVYEKLSELVEGKVGGARSTTEINAELQQLARAVPESKATVAELQAVVDNIAAAEAKAVTAAETVRATTAREAGKVAAKESEAAMAGLQTEAAETAATRLTGTANLFGKEAPQGAYERLARLAGERRDIFKAENKRLYGEVEKHEMANAEIFNIAATKAEIKALRQGLVDKDGKVIALTSPQDQAMISSLIGAKNLQSLANLRAFRTKVYNSIGDDAILPGIDDFTKKKIGAKITEVLTKQSGKGGKEFKALLDEANTHYKAHVAKFDTAGVNKLFLDPSKPTGAIFPGLVKDVAENAGQSQMYRNLVKLLGRKSPEMREVDELIRGQLMRRAYDAETNTINLGELIKSIEIISKTSPQMAKNFGFDKTALDTVRTAVNAFKGSSDISARHLQSLFDAGFFKGKNIATDVTSFLKIGTAKRENIADEVIKALGGITDTGKRAAIRTELTALETAESEAAKLIRAQTAKGKGLTAAERLEAQQAALTAMEDDPLLMALRGDALPEGVSTGYRKLYSQIFGYSEEGGAITNAKLKEVMSNLNRVAEGSSPQAETAKRLVDDIRRAVRMEHYTFVSTTPSKSAGASVIEKQAAGETGLFPSAINLQVIKYDKPYREYLKTILGKEEFAADELLADAMLATARKEAAAKGTGSMVSKTSYASVAQGSQPAEKLDVLLRTWLLSTALANYGVRGAAKPLVWTAQKAAELAVNPSMQRAARIVVTQGQPAIAEYKRQLYADYGKDDGEKIWATINTLSDMYDPEKDGPIDEEE